MYMRRSWLDLGKREQRKLIAAARDAARVTGLTHGFYKYPARFSPIFVRTAIEVLSAPGDLCVDPHVGGGTTLVEARALGRDAVGIDISTLADFVSRTKTTVYSNADLELLESWAGRLAKTVHIRKSVKSDAAYEELGYYRHLSHPDRWRLRKAIDLTLASARRLSPVRLERFARCAILKTAQWALDGRKQLPTVEEFRVALEKNVAEMLEGASQFSNEVRRHGARPYLRVLNRSSAGAEHDAVFDQLPPPKLIITSPPYPGVHVLYHRWQVDGRKETPLPFMIANKLDGAGSSFYTMGDRKHPELKTYFESVEATLSSMVKLADEETVFVQMVAFSEPSWQLERYNEAMVRAGLSECFLSVLDGEGDGRLWRSVPNRRWYSDQRGETPGSQEVVLIHRKVSPVAGKNTLRRPAAASSAKLDKAVR
jgi:hypothetical protein